MYLLEDSRRELHGSFLLPTNRPVFRRSNALTLGSKQTTDNYLVNPHLALPDITGNLGHLKYSHMLRYINIHTCL